jgi:hypothetical protein
MEHQQAFNSLKNYLARKVVLAYPDFSVPFEIYTDTSKYQMGSITTQKDKPLAFYSRKLTELLAIVETLCEYKCILLRHLITIYTDHKNLTFSNFTTNHVTCWWLIVEEYSPNIVYLPGKQISSPMLSLAYQNLMSRMMNQHFQSPLMLFPKHNLLITKFNGVLQTMTQNSKQE